MGSAAQAGDVKCKMQNSSLPKRISVLKFRMFEHPSPFFQGEAFYIPFREKKCHVDVFSVISIETIVVSSLGVNLAIAAHHFCAIDR